MNNIFDSHAHYDDEAFDGDRDELLQSLPLKGVTAVVNCGCDKKSSVTTLALSEKYSFIYAAVGVHPHEAADASEEDFSFIRNLYSNKKVVAIGEIGLDYHYDFSPRDIQLAVFERQIRLACELRLPVIVHDREAHEDTFKLLKKYKPSGVVHCFSGSAEMARQTVDLGMYIGLGGAITFKNARKPLDVAHEVPADYLLLETDCPYMTPVPYRGKRNDSSMIPLSAGVIAAARGEDVQQLLDRTAQNAARLFGIET